MLRRPHPHLYLASVCARGMTVSQTLDQWHSSVYDPLDMSNEMMQDFFSIHCESNVRLIENVI